MVRTLSLPTGVSLEYVERGSADGMPVILLHGVTDSWRSFEHLLPHLPAAIRAIAVSLRGHGASSRPQSGYGYADMAADVRDVMDALELPSAVVVGHSMGSLVAQRLAADHPERVSGLVLIGSFASLDRNAAVREYYERDIVSLADPVPDAFAREFQVSTLARPLPAGQLETFVGESLKVPARVWQAAFAGFVSTPCPCRDLAATRVPTLLLWGAHDTYASRDEQETLRVAIPGARLIVYADAGHAVHWEQPERVAADLVSHVYERR